MGDKTDLHEKVWPTLATHALGILPSRLAAMTDAHLEECHLCRERLAGYTSAVDRLTIAGDRTSPELVRMWEGVRDRVRRHAVERSGLRLVSGDN